MNASHCRALLAFFGTNIELLRMNPGDVILNFFRDSRGLIPCHQIIRLHITKGVAGSDLIPVARFGNNRSRVIVIDLRNNLTVFVGFLSDVNIFLTLGKSQLSGHGCVRLRRQSCHARCVAGDPPCHQTERQGPRQIFSYHDVMPPCLSICYRFVTSGILPSQCVRNLIKKLKSS